ncbi:MAG: glutamate--tRNA ligase [Myxococcales bacterium]|nr:glutamate--tRNA ligase [Myxococcales bacterium]
MTTRLRFAPSPTGYLHLGGARTALFNWLYARHTGGKFLLRIEDTDQDRNTDASRQAILDGMAWLGMHADEPIVIQSERVEMHRAAAHRLVAEGKAYKCFSTVEDIEIMRETASADGRKPKYDNTWRDRTDHPTDGRPYVIRFKTPLEGTTTFHDLVLGDISVNNEELDDLIILRSDNWPTYNFVVVCDDGDMGITHVCRGQDHVSNTFKQVHLYQALGYPLPKFAHLPMIEGLSKRKGSASVMLYRDNGYHPEAIISYLARLGWSHGDQELFEVSELQQLFELVDCNRASGKFDDEKLLWVNAQWMKRLPHTTIAERLLWHLKEAGIDAQVDDRLLVIVNALVERSPTLVDMCRAAMFAWNKPTTLDEKAVAKFLKNEHKAAFADLIAELAALSVWTPASIEAAVQAYVERTGVGMGKIAQPIRIALTGTAVSPPVHDTLAAVLQNDAIERMSALLDFFHD